jgi:hypothetical protein
MYVTIISRIPRLRSGDSTLKWKRKYANPERVRYLLQASNQGDDHVQNMHKLLHAAVRRIADLEAENSSLKDDVTVARSQMMRVEERLSSLGPLGGGSLRDLMVMNDQKDVAIAGKNDEIIRLSNELISMKQSSSQSTSSSSTPIFAPKFPPPTFFRPPIGPITSRRLPHTPLPPPVMEPKRRVQLDAKQTKAVLQPPAAVGLITRRKLRQSMPSMFRKQSISPLRNSEN